MMGDLDGWKVAQVVGTLFTGVLAWVWSHTVARADKLSDNHQERLKELERSFVTREELAKALASMRADRYQMHKENKTALENLERKLDASNKVVNQVANDVASLSGRYHGLRP
jgi:hypothetical protein